MHGCLTSHPMPVELASSAATLSSHLKLCTLMLTVCAGSGEAFCVALSDGHEHWRTAAAPAALLSASWTPWYAPQPQRNGSAAPCGLVAVSSMAGAVYVLAGDNGDVLASLDLRSRLISKLEWCPATSYGPGQLGSSERVDAAIPPQSLAHGCESKAAPTAHLLAATGLATLAVIRCTWPNAADDASGGAAGPALTIAQTLPFAQNVADFTLVRRAPAPHSRADGPFLSRRKPMTASTQPGSSGRDEAEQLLLVSVRESHSLRLYAVAAPSGSAMPGGGQPGSKDAAVIDVAVRSLLIPCCTGCVLLAIRYEARLPTKHLLCQAIMPRLEQMANQCNMATHCERCPLRCRASSCAT
jgi:hypothetical protein